MEEYNIYNYKYLKLDTEDELYKETTMSDIICDVCNGEGVIMHVDNYDNEEDKFMLELTCPKCSGTGYILDI